MGFIKMIFMILALFFLMRLLGRLFMPMTNSNKKFSGNNSQNSQRETRREGEVRIEYTDKNRPSQEMKDLGEGDYIDFEEIEKK